MAADEKQETTGTGTPGDEPQAPSPEDAAQADKPKKAAKPSRAESADAGAESDAGEKAAAEKPAHRKPVARKSAAADADEKAAAAEKDDAGEKAAKSKKSDRSRPAAKTAAKKPAVTKGTAKAAAKPAARAAKKPAEAAETRPKPKKKAARPAAAKRTPGGPTGVKPAAGALQATVVDADGRGVETVDLAAERFGVAAKTDLLHLVVRAEQAARRSGTASTKTRGEVAGSTAKMYRQKGTGRARAGSVKSPVRTGGGTVFGPKPRDYSIKVNRKVVKRALAMALSSRADSGTIYVARGLQLDEPSTRTVHRLLVSMDIAAPVLVVTHDEESLRKSVRNLGYAQVSEVRDLTTEQVLRARSLVFTEKAFAALDQA